MENQHREITGYRELNESEIAAMNSAKDLARMTGFFVENLRHDAEIDQRWLSIAATDLQQGFMALVRSIAQPTTF